MYSIKTDRAFFPYNTNTSSDLAGYKCQDTGTIEKIIIEKIIFLSDEEYSLLAENLLTGNEMFEGIGGVSHTWDVQYTHVCLVINNDRKEEHFFIHAPIIGLPVK
ncbi:MAG TPA: hypothetical protein VEC36_05930 [Patescibacteria group bacterium]|nr:hypothetical protein [Patescibacteria group bacterium]